ncbi:Predicted Fe-Mo cluster-binding protein, NifX family [Allochromatium warmingii]|uniref:Predicted Fe-Mo cluster-binding protein, NifX family n=1 Tax=Allochromatium warmingii TaxID=61595 RepID=A0A1H3JDL6_ALLWA|nr:NifB/NifX family molybdenum-iron cluster-binding protein [Allochromatium warmingii]SDY37947.1 Predicted Fe-Mo cluster-binding protein, NifX family [Allochromatium warmingii]
MRIAVTSQNFRTITGHAGKTRRFLILEADGQTAPVEIERLDLPAGLALHDHHGTDHPLFAAGVEAVLTQSAGGGFVQRLAREGIAVHITSATDPLSAAADLAAGRPLPAAAPHDEHAHNHGHTHGHGQIKASGAAVQLQIKTPK